MERFLRYIRNIFIGIIIVIFIVKIMPTIIGVDKTVNMLSAIIVILFFSYIFYYFYFSIKTYIQVPRYGRKVRKNISNKKVEKYITSLKYTRLVSPSPKIWGDLRETYRQIAINDGIDYDLKLALYEELRLKGTRGIFNPKKPKELYKKEVEIKKEEAGQEGEKEVEHALEWLDNKRFKVFSDIRLPYNGKSQQFDTIIVGDNGVFNVETKNFVGDLSIDEEGNWYRNIKNKKIGTKNENFQVRRHNRVLSNLLEDKIPIIDLIVWTNIESILEGLEYSQTKIIKIDQLVDYVEEYKSDEKLSKKDI